MLHQAPDQIKPDYSAPLFAQARADAHDESLWAKASGKASRFLARNIHTKTLHVPGPEPLVTFTFDDVPASAYHIGAQVLERHGVRGTYYVCGGGCGTMSPGGRLASVDELGELWKRGHEIGCHTYSHPAVSRISCGQIASDLDRNLAFLAAIDSQIVVRNFAYPYGDFSFRTKRYLQSRFDSCRSLLPGVNDGAPDLGILKTWPLENASADRAKIVRLIAQTVQTRGWLVFSSHDVGEQPSSFGVTPDLLTFAVATAQAAGCTILTIAGVLKIMSDRDSKYPHGRKK